MAASVDSEGSHFFYFICICPQQPTRGKRQPLFWSELARALGFNCFSSIYNRPYSGRFGNGPTLVASQKNCS